MAWVAVDKYDKEYIFQNKPKRNEDLWEDAIYESFDGQGGRLVLHHFSDIYLPKGTIKKLIGRELSWEDNPVELKEDE